MSIVKNKIIDPNGIEYTILSVAKDHLRRLKIVDAHCTSTGASTGAIPCGICISCALIGYRASRKLRNTFYLKTTLSGSRFTSRQFIFIGVDPVSDAAEFDDECIIMFPSSYQLTPQLCTLISARPSSVIDDIVDGGGLILPWSRLPNCYIPFNILELPDTNLTAIHETVKDLITKLAAQGFTQSRLERIIK